MVSREAQRRDQASVILDAARRLFAQRSFDDVTMAEIADEAQVARATVFNHYSSKRGLVDAMTTGIIRFYQEMLAAALADETTSAGDLVRRLFVEMGAGIEPDRAFYRGVFREIARFEVGLEEGSEGAVAAQEARRRLVGLFERGIERGEIRPGHAAEALSSAMTHLVNGTINEWLFADEPTELAGRLESSAEIFLGAVERPGAEA